MSYAYATQPASGVFALRGGYRLPKCEPPPIGKRHYHMWLRHVSHIYFAINRGGKYGGIRWNYGVTVWVTPGGSIYKSNFWGLKGDKA